MNNKTEFLPDEEQDASDKNNVLIEYLSGGWNPFKIVQIQRINKDDTHKSGWMVTYTL